MTVTMIKIANLGLYPYVDYEFGTSPLGLAFDSAGDVFTATFPATGGWSGGGAELEIVKIATGYAATPASIADIPSHGLVLDDSGQLDAVWDYVGGFGLLQILDIGSAYTTFLAVAIAQPQGNMVADSAGDLFGITTGGAYGSGLVFELPKSAPGSISASIVLSSLDFGLTDPDAWTGARLAIDANGDLFGVNRTGTAVFELARTAAGYATTATRLAGNQFSSGVVIDANGNLFGTTSTGGTFGDGTVFEVVRTATGYAATTTVLFNFDGFDGANPWTALTMDTRGDLFGITSNGQGSNVFELARTATGYSGLSTLSNALLNPIDNEPVTGLITDAAGDLFATTKDSIVEFTGLAARPLALEPLITGMGGQQATTDGAAIDPFHSVTITDANQGQPVTVTVASSIRDNGFLADASAATDGSTITDGVWTVTGSAAAVTAALDRLIFRPSDHQAALGSSVTTRFTVTVVDGAGQTNGDSTTSVIATAVAAGPGNVTFIADGGSFNGAVRLDGGTGINTLELVGGGGFNLTVPLSLNNIQIVTLTEGQAALTPPGGSAGVDTLPVVFLRPGDSRTINVLADQSVDTANPNPVSAVIYGAGNTDVINLGTGADILYSVAASETINGGDSGTATVHLTAATMGAAVTGHGGIVNLDIDGGGTATMDGSLTGITSVHLMGGTSGVAGFIFAASAIKGLQIFGSHGNDIIATGDASQAVYTYGDATLVHATAATAGAAIRAVAGSATLDIAGGGTATLNSLDSRLTVMVDQASLLNLGGASFITATAATAGSTLVAQHGNQTLMSLLGGDTLIGASTYLDTFKGSASGLNGDVVANFGESDVIDITDFTAASGFRFVQGSGADAGQGTLSFGSQEIVLAGMFTAGHFAISSDGGTGSRITYMA